MWLFCITDCSIDSRFYYLGPATAGELLLLSSVCVTLSEQDYVKVFATIIMQL